LAGGGARIEPAPEIAVTATAQLHHAMGHDL
jgi:hypothetical protein